ncbi:hypothetical protein [Candidatus Promineifilum breve]|nr:hypothetical protein [Candidatus Promineifilum breve]
MNPALVIVTGASGAGKMAAVRRLAASNRPGLHCYFFDSIGVPSEEEMVRESIIGKPNEHRRDFQLRQSE